MSIETRGAAPRSGRWLGVCGSPRLRAPAPLDCKSARAGVISGHAQRTKREHGRAGQHRGLPGHRSRRRRRPGADRRRRPAQLHRGRPARQGGGREPRAGARGLGRPRIGAAAAAHHGQPGARRPAEGGQPLRPADRARPAHRHGGAAGRRARRIYGARRAWPGRRPGAGGRRAAQRAPRRGLGAGPDLPGGPGRRGRLGGRRRGAGARHPAGPGQPLQGHPGPDPSGAGAGRGRRRGSGPQGHQGPGDGQTGARSDRSRRPTC